MPQDKLHLKPILMATSVAVEPLSVKNTLDAQPLPGPSSSLSATCKHTNTHTERETETPDRIGNWQERNRAVDNHFLRSYGDKVYGTTHTQHGDDFCTLSARKDVWYVKLGQILGT